MVSIHVYGNDMRDPADDQHEHKRNMEDVPQGEQPFIALNRATSMTASRYVRIAAFPATMRFSSLTESHPCSSAWVPRGVPDHG